MVLLLFVRSTAKKTGLLLHRPSVPPPKGYGINASGEAVSSIPVCVSYRGRDDDLRLEKSKVNSDRVMS